MYQLDIQPGLGNVMGDYQDPVVFLSISRDGGHVFSNMQRARIGRIGQRMTRAFWRNKGIARSWVPRIEINASVAPFVILGDSLEITVNSK